MEEKRLIKQVKPTPQHNTIASPPPCCTRRSPSNNNTDHNPAMRMVTPP